MCGFGYGAYGAAGGWGWLVDLAVMVLFWGGLIALVIWGLRSFTSARRAPDSALEVLRRRFAAGEITHDEYEKTRSALQG